jgi:hypothetical protein
MEIVRDDEFELSARGDNAPPQVTAKGPTRLGGCDFGGAGRFDPRLFYFRALLDSDRFFGGRRY